MDSETVKLIIAAALGGGGAFFGKWVLNTYIPSLQKKAEDRAIHDRQQEDSTQTFGSNIATDMFEHIRGLTDGEAATRHAEITQALRDLGDKLDKLTASFNQILVFMSRNQAALPVIGPVSDWTDVEAIKAAAVTSAAEQGAAKVVEASTGPVEPTVEGAKKMITVVEALPSEGDK